MVTVGSVIVHEFPLFFPWNDFNPLAANGC